MPNPGAENEDSQAGRMLPAGIQRRSTRDLEKCIRADLLRSLDPKGLEELRRLANEKPAAEKPDPCSCEGDSNPDSGIPT